MSGKHRKKISRPAAAVAAVVTPAGVLAAALAVSGFSPGAAPSTTETSAPSAVDLLALITPANSTAQFFAGTTYYGTNYANTSYAPQQVVPFLAGPQGIANAISGANDGPGGDRTVVLASGWGAGQTGTALGELAQNNPGALSDIDLAILDNNTNRAAGGFWTTYAPFAPLLGTSAAPTSSNLDSHVLDVAYAYNINSDAPTDPLNPFAVGNSLAAYAYGYGGEQTADVPQAAIDEAKGPSNVPHHHYIVHPDGTYTAVDLPGSSTTYVTFESEHLPLLRPLRLVPGGDIVANTLEPTTTELVDAGYQNGKPIPSDPRVPQPMTPGSSLGNLGGVPGSIPAGLAAGASTATQDVTSPTNLITKPIDEAGKLPSLPGVSSLPGLSPSTLTNSSVSSNTLKASSPNKFLPGLPGTGNNSPSGSSGGGNGLKNVADTVNNAVKNVTDGLTGK
ncbi:PE-PPE domain-containing protein [Mycobacterium sp. JS623]|uniref:PE-PPE domain-containing protein n=1 Tax=Mycobacterium sp. JS623 TaxID=212767 RepID=UPI0002A5B94A|nr:PE-PPE domain-containing protein [Mycobacterium sp. JS623]AGB20774.1 PE-PPE domain-containing protein [Mycobacterium sp. JS623]